MPGDAGEGKILIVDDEWESAIVASVRRKLEDEGWRTAVVAPQERSLIGDAFEAAALYEIEEQQPDAVLLDVRFGDDPADRFKGLGILRKILDRHPSLPVLVFTQYAQGPDRETAASGSLKWEARVDFIDKLASPEEVLLRLRRLIGTAPQVISVGSRISLDVAAELVYVMLGDDTWPVGDIKGMRFEILRELAQTWYRSPGELVPIARLARFSGGENASASVRVRIREIKDSLGRALGVHFGAGDLIVNVRDKGYRLIPPRL